jgi:agmatinase
MSRQQSTRTLQRLAAVLALLALGATGHARAEIATGAADCEIDSCTAPATTSAENPFAQIRFPDDLAATVALLSPEQQAFLQSERVTPFAATPEKLIEALQSRPADQIKAYVEAMMWVDAQGRFDPERDEASIPLNTASPEFNAWKTRRPRSFDPPREAGPVSLSRYMSGWGVGIPTFASAPVALTPEDLIAGKVEVAIVGAPLNMGSGWRDADHGPLALRLIGGMGGNDQYTMIDASKELRIVDYGDIAIDNLSTERSMQHVREVVREIAATGAIPFIIGGDHSLEYPNVAALADVYGKGNVGVVHFDAHYDAGSDRAHLIDHGQPVYRLINEGHVPGRNFIQVGLRANGPDEKKFKWMREQGFRYHSMAEVERRGWDAVIERAVAEAREGGKKMHISFDVDVLDPAYMTGTGTPVPSGMHMREAIPIIRRLCAESDVVGFDLVEVAPALDPNYTTSINSAYIAKACLTGIAARKLGLTQPHYLSPLSSEHAQDDYYGAQ